MVRVFVYGSLLRGLHNSHLLSGAPLLLPGARTVEHYVLVDSAHGYPYANSPARTPPALRQDVLPEMEKKIASFLPALLLADGVRDRLCSHRERTAGLLQPGTREA